MKTILLCSDLDRTLIPNGAQDESAQARPVFSHLAALKNLHLAYVSGRDKGLVQEAIADYHLPEPDYVIGDVGTTLYRIIGGRWQTVESWSTEIGRDWGAYDRESIAAMIEDMEGEVIERQPPQKQGRHKISYFTDPKVDERTLKEQIASRFDGHGVASNLIWSYDEAEHRGLLDILPRGANKLRAIQFLMNAEGIGEADMVFAGDSGNDLDVLTSGLQAILVRNAAEDVRQSALDQLPKAGQNSCLYLAKGGFYGMNGNYAAGVLEGLVHFFPETAHWVESALLPYRQ